MKIHCLIFSLLVASVVGKRSSSSRHSKYTKKRSSKHSLRTKRRTSKHAKENRCLNLEVNFAFGGALTNDKNRELECLGGILRSCSEVETNQGYLNEADLVLAGVVQQIDFAVESLKDEHKNKDLFMLLAGGEYI